jgi:hypothetical protein
VGIENLLSRLDGVKPTGPDSWKAKCPAHPDKSPSLTVRALADGRILIHDFAGCSAVDVVGAVGLEMTDLFPEPLTKEFMPRTRAPFSPMDALTCLVAESSIIAIAASDIVAGKPLTDHDLERVATATGRIATALEVCHGGR